jgi:alanyl-tRNA synthetase
VKRLSFFLLSLLSFVALYGMLPHPAHAVEMQSMMMFQGSKVFRLKDTHGVPLDFTLDKIVNQLGGTVEWPSFIEAARSAGWRDFMTYEALCHGMQDADLPLLMQEAIQERFKLYVLTNPHPKTREQSC